MFLEQATEILVFSFSECECIPAFPGKLLDVHMITLLLGGPLGLLQV